MKTFKRYFSEREEPALGDMGNSGSHEALVKMFNIASEDHKDKLLKFFADLAHRDGKIKEELQNYNRGKVAPKSGNPNSEDEKDIIVPSSADGYGDETEG